MTSPPQPKTIRAHRGAGAAEVRALDRSVRTPKLLDAPVDADARVRALRLAVIGLGSVGSYVADLLARWGVAFLLLVDRACIRPESVLTHPVQPGAIGRAKATRAGEAAKAVSPSTAVQVHDGPIEELSLETLAGLDGVVLASDNLACELEVSQRCLRLGVPVTQAAVHGPTLVAQVRVLANAPGDHGQGACLACGYLEADWEALDRGTTFSCAGSSPDDVPERAGPPTVSPPQLCSTAASLAVNEVLARAAGLRPLDDRMIEFRGYTQTMCETPLERRDDCPADHRPWRVETIGRGALRASTPRELLDSVRRSGGAGGAGTPSADGNANGDTGTQAWLVDAALHVPGFAFTRLGMCACSPHPVLGRFVPLGDAPGPCESCGKPLVCHPFYTHETVPGLALSSHLDLALRDLGAADARTVLARVGDDAVFFVPAPRSAPGSDPQSHQDDGGLS